MQEWNSGLESRTCILIDLNRKFVQVQAISFPIRYRQLRLMTFMSHKLCGGCLTKINHQVWKYSAVYVNTELWFEMILQKAWRLIQDWSVGFTVKTCVNNFSWAVWRFLLRVRRNLRFDASSLIPYLNLHRFITLHPINMVNIFIRFIFEPFESQTPWDYSKMITYDTSRIVKYKLVPCTRINDAIIYSISRTVSTEHVRGHECPKPESASSTL